MWRLVHKKPSPQSSGFFHHLGNPTFQLSRARPEQPGTRQPWGDVRTSMNEQTNFLTLLMFLVENVRHLQIDNLASNTKIFGWDGSSISPLSETCNFFKLKPLCKLEVVNLRLNDCGRAKSIPELAWNGWKILTVQKYNEEAKQFPLQRSQ